MKIQTRLSDPNHIIVTMLDGVSQHCNNIHAMLCACCGSVAESVVNRSGENVKITFCESCAKVVLNVRDGH